MSRRQALVLIVLVPAIVVGSLLIGRALRSSGDNASLRIANASDETEFEHEYLIPPGTGASIDAGETIEIVPRELTVSVGDAIRIVNNDSRDHIVGVFFVGAGETLTQRFTSPGTLEGECSIHTDGEFTLEVVE